MTKLPLASNTTPPSPHEAPALFTGTSVFAWPAWRRLLVVLPALLLLWLGVAWAMPGLLA